MVGRCVPVGFFPLGNAGKPPPADFLHISRIARVLSKEALLNYSPEHKQCNENKLPPSSSAANRLVG
jgi:hypothetical protein